MVLLQGFCPRTACDPFRPAIEPAIYRLLSDCSYKVRHSCLPLPSSKRTTTVSLILKEIKANTVKFSLLIENVEEPPEGENGSFQMLIRQLMSFIPEIIRIQTVRKLIFAYHFLR